MPSRPRRPAAAVAPPLLLTGPPSRVAGLVTIANTGSQPLAVSAARVLHAELDEAPATLAAVVAPGSTQAAEVVAAYPPGTPPGTYAAHVDVGGQQREAQVVVEANAANTVRPNRIYLTGPTAQSVDVELEVTNTGNVDLPLALIATAPLVVVVPFGIDQGPEVMVAFNGLDPFSIVVPPGQARRLTATVTLPDQLDRTRRQQALVPVGMADLRVFVLPRDLDPLPAPRVETTSARSTSARRAPATRAARSSSSSTAPRTTRRTSKEST